MVTGSSPDEVTEYFSVYLFLPAALRPEVYSDYNINEYQEQNNSVSGEWSAAGAQDWQPHRHLRANCLDNVGSLTTHNPTDLHELLQE
jgi:hypothetical protein